MRAKFLTLSIPAILLIAIPVFVLSLQPATAAPPDNPTRLVGHITQESGVTLTKETEKEAVPLGEVVSYTVTINNDGVETINATLTDVLPEGLVLQKTISATVGTANFDLDKNMFTWSGSIPAGEEALIYYGAIPPTTSSPDQTLTNVATLEFAGTTLEAGATVTTYEPDLNIWNQFVNLLALVLVWMDAFIANLSIPYSFGFAIVLFTVTVRLLTFPLNMQQIKSSKAMQALQPELKKIQEKHKDDREKLAQEQMKLYKENGVNPLGGCLPMLVQMPIWFALYQSLRQLSREGLLNEGFFWIPSLSGPVSDWGAGFPPEWIWPFVNGAPPLGWAATLAYLVLPVLLVVSQLYMQQMMTPPSSDPQQASVQSIMKFMPFMFGYFALVVPSGLTLYWFTSNLLAIVQQYFTKTQLKTEPEAAGASTKTPAPATAEVGVGAADSAATTNPGGSTKSQNARKSKRKKRRKRK